MKRTTIYLEPELEVLLKMEMLRRKQPMAEIVREAVYAYVTREPRRAPPGAGDFASGRADTAERAEAVLRETGFAAPAPDESPHRSDRVTASRKSRPTTRKRIRR
jgi:hypothetical protein